MSFVLPADVIRSLTSGTGWTGRDARSTLCGVIVLVVHALLGIGTVWWLVRSNPDIFRRTAAGPLISTAEGVLYAVGIASVIGGYAFNIAFVREYSQLGGFHNPLWGDGSWAQYIDLMYANPAAGSAGIDYTIANVVLLPLVTVRGARRHGIAKPWLFFISTLFTSFTFGWALYAATLERQRRISDPTHEHVLATT
jgi:hypothetical protein